MSKVSKLPSRKFRCCKDTTRYAGFEKECTQACNSRGRIPQSALGTLLAGKNNSLYCCIGCGDGEPDPLARSLSLRRLAIIDLSY